MVLTNTMKTKKGAIEFETVVKIVIVLAVMLLVLLFFKTGFFKTGEGISGIGSTVSGQKGGAVSNITNTFKNVTGLKWG